MSKFITIIVSMVLLHFSTTSYGSNLPDDALHARCGQWRYMLTKDLNDRSVKLHLKLASKTLSFNQVMYQNGLAEGIIIGLSYQTKVSTNTLIEGIYNEHCVSKKI